MDDSHRGLRLAPGRPIGTRDSDRRHCQPPNLSGLAPRAQVDLETDAALDCMADLP